MILSLISTGVFILLSLYYVKDLPVVAVVTDEVKEQLVEASVVTKKAFTTYRREAEAEEHQAVTDGTPVPTPDKGQEEGEMSVIITIMQPILRLMQLLCENHNRDLQVSQLVVCQLLLRLNPPTRDMLTFPDLCSEFLPRSVIQKRNHVENRHHLQNFLMSLFPYLVCLVLVSVWGGFWCLVLASSSCPDRRLPSCTDCIYTAAQGRLSFSEDCQTVEWFCFASPVWVQVIDLLLTMQHRWSILFLQGCHCTNYLADVQVCMFKRERKKVKVPPAHLSVLFKDISPKKGLMSLYFISLHL